VFLEETKGIKKTKWYNKLVSYCFPWP